jgi:hypothetical protein
MDCDKSPLMHKHHIIPRYMGGTNDKDNLVEVSITQHAMFHYCNYQLWNNIEDYVAWRGLSHQVSQAEFLIEKFKIFGKIGSDRLQEKLKDNPQLKEEIKQKQIKSWNKNREIHIEKARLHQPKGVESARTPEAIEKKKNTFKEIHHQQGEKNSQYGKMWITNGTKEGTYRINKGDPIPKCYKPGRVSLKEENSKYVYVITTPDEKTIKTALLYSFCKDNGLCYACALRVSKGQRKHHKGYKVFPTRIKHN